LTDLKIHYEDRLLLPAGLMSKAFGITPAAFYKWPVSSIKKVGRERLYYLPDCIAVKRSQDTRDQLDLTEERARLTMHQADKVELEVKVMRGELIPSDIIARVWSEYTSNMRAKLLGLPSTVAPRVAGGTMAEVETEIRELIFDALDELKEYAGSDYSRKDRDEADSGLGEIACPATGPKRKPVGRRKKGSVKRGKRGTGLVED